ncbi:thioredoxin family protein [Pedobacter nototheniae]|uniref:TlpA family protein disulfide reductase n=1 Tax=Pedobacter nototheniae TaxID=2488994 RepID=UPI00292D7E39|nr:thioredoxin family protein [Pedobacter nototheniae]
MNNKLRSIILVFLIFHLTATRSQTIFNGVINQNELVKKGLEEMVIITDYSKLDFSATGARMFRPTMQKFYLDSISNKFLFTITRKSPTIIEFQIQEAVYHVYATPKDTVFFNVNYKGDVPVSKESEQKWSMFANRNDIYKQSVIQFKGKGDEENAFLNNIELRYGRLDYGRTKFNDVDLLEYKRTEVDSIYNGQMQALTQFNEKHKRPKFYQLAKELIEDNYIMNLLAPIYNLHSIHLFPQGYFNKDAKNHIEDIIKSASQSYYLYDAKWRINDLYLNGDAVQKKKSRQQYVDRYTSAKKIFKDKPDFNYIASYLVNDMIGRYVLDDSIINRYASDCTNQIYVQNILKSYYDRKGSKLEASENLKTIITQDTFVNASKQTIDLFNLVPKDKLILLDIGASWCAPCRYNDPILNRLSKKELLADNIYVAGISFDQDINKWVKSISGASDKHLPLSHQFLVKKGFQSQIAKALGVSSIPQYILLSPSFEILNKEMPRPADEKEFIGQIEKYINKYKPHSNLN